MPLPDLKSQKVLAPALVYLLVKWFIRLDHVSETLLFGILCYAVLKYLTNLTITRGDIVLPTVMFYIYPYTNMPMDSQFGIFLLANAFIRLIIPSNV
jgi:hypothetical protein